MPERDLTDRLGETQLSIPRTGRLEQTVHGTANTMLGDNNTLLKLQTENPEVASRFLQTYLPGSRIAPPRPDGPITLEDDLQPRPEVHAEVASALAQGVSLIVTGAPGSGKSVLLKQITVQRDGVYIDAGKRSPVRVLRQLLAALEPDAALPQEADALLDAIEDALIRTPRLLLIDLGEDPERLLGYLGQLRFPSGAVLATTTYPSSAPREFREQRLSPLTPQEIRAWLDAHGRILLPGEFIRLTETSAGNPLYLRAYLKLEGHLIPADLHALEEHLWRQGNAFTQDLLALVALSIHPLDVSTVTEILTNLGRAGTTPADVMAAVAQSQGQLEISEGHLRPFHGHFRDFIDQLLEGQGAATRYHLQLAEHAFQIQDLAGAGFHFLRTKDERLHDVVQTGGTEAFVSGEWSLASQLLTIAEDDAVREGQFENAGRVALVLANAHNMLRLPDTQAVTQRAVDHFERAGETGGAMIAKIFRSVLKISTPENAEGLEELEEARRYFQHHPPDDMRTLGMLNINLSFAYMHVGSFRKGMAVALQAMQIFSDTDDAFAKASALQNYGGCAARLEKLSEAQRSAEQLLEQATALNQARWAASAHNTLTMVYRKRGEPDIAEDHAREAIRFSQRLNNVGLQALNLANLGNTFVDRDRIPEAEDAYREALSILEDRPQHWADQIAHLKELKARIRMDQEHWGAALTLVQEALDIQRQIGDRLRIATLLEKLCTIHAQSEDWQAAAQAAEESARIYADDFPEDGVNRWSEAAVLWAETPHLERSIRAVRSAFVTAYPEDSSGPTTDAPTVLLTTLLAHEDAHFLMLLMRSVVRWAVHQGERGELLEMTRMLREKVFEGHQRAAAALAYVILEGQWQLGALDRLTADLVHGRPHFHFHEREDGSGIWTVGIQTTPIFVAQIDVFTETSEIRAAGLALALLLDTQAEGLNEVMGAFGIQTPLADVDLLLISQEDQEQYIPAMTPMFGQALETRFVVAAMGENVPASCVISRRWPAGYAKGKTRSGRGYVSLLTQFSTVLWDKWRVPDEDQDNATRALVRFLLP